MDWTGDTNSVMKALGASNHSDTVREQNDYYATDPKMVEALLKVETFDKYIWEPACGEGHIAKVLEAHGYDVSSSDLIYRGYGDAEPYDFLKHNDYLYDMDIITNPPYKYALEFVEKALASISEGHKVAMLLKLQFLEGQKGADCLTKTHLKRFTFSVRGKNAQKMVNLPERVQLRTHGSFGEKGTMDLHI